MDSLALVLVEAAVERVPPGIARHPAVLSYAKRFGRDPRRAILDRSYHHAAMRRLEDAHKRGRPDIAYHVLLDAVSTPLYRRGLLELYVSTRDGMVIRVGRGVRLPRSYHQFVGLLEDLYDRGEIRSEEGELLLSIRREGLGELLEEIKPDRRLLLWERGELRDLGEIAASTVGSRHPAIGIGGFPAGDFEEGTLQFFEERASLGQERYDASLVSCRLLYEVERRALGPQRLK